MKGHINAVLNLVKGYRCLWIAIPIIGLVTFAVSLLGVRAVHSRGLQYGSREQIRQILFEATPRGTTRQIVRRFVDAKGWRSGGRVRSTGGPNGEPVDRISVYVGEARGVIVDERVYAEWIFDAEDILVDIDVYKITLVP